MITWLSGGASGGMAVAPEFKDESEGFQAALAVIEPESLAFIELEAVALFNRTRWRF